MKTSIFSTTKTTIQSKEEVLMLSLNVMYYLLNVPMADKLRYLPFHKTRLFAVIDGAAFFFFFFLITLDSKV